MGLSRLISPVDTLVPHFVPQSSLVGQYRLDKGRSLSGEGWAGEALERKQRNLTLREPDPVDWFRRLL